MYLRVADVKVIDKTNGKVIVLQLTLVEKKDVYLLVSGFRKINSDTSML